jgi:hypothetical protein
MTALLLMASILTKPARIAAVEPAISLTIHKIRDIPAIIKTNRMFPG